MRYSGFINLQQSYSRSLSSHHLQSDALASIKTILHSSAAEADISLYGECYLISTEEGAGLQWNKFSKSILKPILLAVPPEKLGKDFMRKVFSIYT